MHYFWADSLRFMRSSLGTATLLPWMVEDSRGSPWLCLEERLAREVARRRQAPLGLESCGCWNQELGASYFAQSQNLNEFFDMFQTRFRKLACFLLRDCSQTFQGVSRPQSLFGAPVGAWTTPMHLQCKATSHWNWSTGLARWSTFEWNVTSICSINSTLE